MGIFELEPGDVFASEYRILDALGQGTVGATYEAEHLYTGRRGALKVMRTVLPKEPRTLERFAREACTAANLDRSRVAQVLDAGIESAGRKPWLFVEMLSGQNLADFIAKHGPLSRVDAATVFEQLRLALGAAHAAQIVHRNLKPENIFVVSRDSFTGALAIKVLDFGIVHDAGQVQGSLFDTKSAHAPLWSAPEQLESGSPNTPASDVWALGLLAFYALTGRLFWRGAHVSSVSPQEIRREVVSDEIPSASQRAQQLGVALSFPSGFDAWFQRCVHRDPSKRFVDASLALKKLDILLATGDAALLLEESPKVQFPPPQMALAEARANWPWAVLAIVVGMFLVWCIFFVSSPP